MEPSLAASGLCKKFGELAVARDIDLVLTPGARHALIGPNGAGKSTLVGMLTGHVRPDAGRVALHGTDITGLPPHMRVRRGLVRTFQISSLFEKMTVLENVLVVVQQKLTTNFRIFHSTARWKAEVENTTRILEQLSLADVRNRRVAEIAYGQRRLLEVAIVLALSPGVVLLDEPAAGIPNSEVDVLLRALQLLPASMSLLIIEHDMAIVRQIAAEITVLSEGAVLTSGKPQEVMNSPQVRSVYLGRGDDGAEKVRAHA